MYTLPAIRTKCVSQEAVGTVPDIVMALHNVSRVALSFVWQRKISIIDNGVSFGLPLKYNRIEL